MRAGFLAGLALVLLLASGGAGLAQTRHPCAADASQKAAALLKLHLDDPGLALPAAVDPAVKALAPVKALKGNGRFDVLEVWGHVYKADYRMRFLYAQIKGSCVVVGQEILDAGDPY